MAGGYCSNFIIVIFIIIIIIYVLMILIFSYHNHYQYQAEEAILAIFHPVLFHRTTGKFTYQVDKKKLMIDDDQDHENN